MNWTTKLKERLTPSRTPRKPRPGRLIEPRKEDAWRDYPSTGLTPSRLMAILRQADAGDPSQCMQLFEEMEEKDPHLYAVANTRRIALTGLEWQIVSAAEFNASADRVAADEAAAYCRETLAKLTRFDEILQFLALAIGRNIAVAELIWQSTPEGITLQDIEPVEFTRLIFDDYDRPRILTSDNPNQGITVEPGKFIVHAPHAISGHPSRGGLLRATALTWLAKNLSLKGWLVFTEVFGMPVRIGRYDATVSEQEKQELLRMLEQMGRTAAGIFSQAVQLEIVEANRGTQPPPYEKLIDFLNREMSKAWLGQTLTTETSGLSGVFSASKIHEQVRKDIRADDIRKEGRTIRRDILGPLTRFRFGPDIPVPYFRRIPAGPNNTGELIEILDAAVNRLGIPVPERWAMDALGIPQVSAQSELIRGNRE